MHIGGQNSGPDGEQQVTEGVPGLELAALGVVQPERLLHLGQDHTEAEAPKTKRRKDDENSKDKGHPGPAPIAFASGVQSKGPHQGWAACRTEKNPLHLLVASEASKHRIPGDGMGIPPNDEGPFRIFVPEAAVRTNRFGVLCEWVAIREDLDCIEFWTDH